MYLPARIRSIGRNSKKDPGHPWSIITGTAEGLVEKRAAKCRLYVSPLYSTGILKLGKLLILSSTCLLCSMIVS